MEQFADALAEALAERVAHHLRLAAPNGDARTGKPGQRYRLLVGDAERLLRTLPTNSVDSVVCDPPWGIHVGGASWDYFSSPKKYVAFIERIFGESLRVLKPGGHALVCSTPRTQHLAAIGIERAGFGIRDAFVHLFAQGAAPSIDISRAIDAEQGARGRYGAPKSGAHAYWLKRGWVVSKGSHRSYERPSKRNPKSVERHARRYLPASVEAKRWVGWGTALRPSFQTWILARKPLVGSLAQNVARFGTGALNIDACRLASGGWPPNVALSHDWNCDESGCSRGCPVAELERQQTGASRFYYVPRPTRQDRGRGNTHGAVKSTRLTDFLVRLVTPAGATVLDPLCGSATVGASALLGNWSFIGIERDRVFARIARRRLAKAARGFR